MVDALKNECSLSNLRGIAFIEVKSEKLKVTTRFTFAFYLFT